MGAAAGYAVASEGDPAAGGSEGAAPEIGAVPAPGSTVEPFHGVHQAGVETPLQANATFVALDLKDDVDREALVRLMRLLTDDVERLSEGRPALADPQPELAGVPARLTVTVGYGMGLLEAAGLADQAPAWLAEGLPAFSIDKLQDRWTGRRPAAPGRGRGSGHGLARGARAAQRRRPVRDRPVGPVRVPPPGEHRARRASPGATCSARWTAR